MSDWQLPIRSVIAISLKTMLALLMALRLMIGIGGRHSYAEARFRHALRQVITYCDDIGVRGRLIFADRSSIIVR